MKRSCLGLLLAFSCLVISPIPSRSQGLASPSRILPDDPVSRITPCDRGQVKGNAGGFEIDGNLVVDQAGGPTFDWFAFPSGAIGPIDPANCMLIDPDRFQFSAYDRDGGEAATIDPTVFSNVSNKNNDDISTAQGWNWIAGNGQPLRNDIGDVFGTIVTSIDPQTQQPQTWLVMAAAIRTPRGEGHLDFEVNRAGFVQNGTTQGKIYGLGPDRGRTKARDLVISMDFRRGGAEAIASARMWNGAEFCPFDDRVCLQNNGIVPPPDGSWFAATNCAAASMPCLTTDAQGLEVQNYGERQFVEAAVNLTRLGIVLDNPEAAHVLVKTGTSDSFTSDLQDFSLMGFKKPRKPPACPSIVATPDAKLDCGASVTLCAPPPAPGTKYQWSSPGLFISQPESSCVTVKLDTPGPRTFYLEVSAADDHRCASKCSFKVYVDCVAPLCPKIYASADPITLGESVRLCFAPDPALKYRWGCGSRLVISEPDSSCITVTPPDTGVVTCQLKVMQKADTTKFVYCPFSFRVKPPVCKIACPTPTLSPGDKITLGQSIRICVPSSSSVSYHWTSPQFPLISEPDSTCITITPTKTGVVNVNLKTKLRNNPSCYVNCPIVIVVNCPAMTCPPIAATPGAIRLGGAVTLCTPPNSTLSYRWSSPDGAVAEPDSVCLTVTPPTPGPHGYHLKVMLKADTTCSVDCPYTVDVGARSPVCAVNPILPDRTLACGDTATYCGSLQEPPLSGAIVTYEWTIVGGQILTAPSAACVQVKAGQATEFKLTLRISLSNTPPGEPCSITVPLLAPKCEVLAVEPTRTLACGDTATYYVTISPPGGTLVYQWTIVGGTLETSPIASYVRVRAGNGGQFTLSVTTKRNNCPVSCERIVALTPLKCDILPFNPSRALACGDTASFCAGILPATGVITYQWTITGGAIDGSATGPCVRIRTAGAQVTLHLEARRNNCATTCERIISVGGFTCEVAPFDPSRALSCGDTASYCAALTPPGPATYTWTITGGTIETSPSGPCVRVKAGAPGAFTLSVEVRRGDCASSCAKTVPIGGLKCDIMAFDPNRVLACGDTASFCALITPGGGNLIYEWTIVGGTIVTPPSAQCVTVKSGNGGEFTLKLDVKRNNCTTSCDRSVPLGPPKCVIDFDASRIFACGDTATFCARVIPGDGTITYEWTVLGGAILTPGSASCVTVKAGTGAQFTVMLTVRRNNCPTTCDRTLPIAPPSCEIAPIVTRTLACGDTATFCASVLPSGGSVTYLWSVSGGTLISAADGACVTVQAGSGGTFSLHLAARRNGCATECDRTAPLAAITCAINPLVTRTLACGDSATYCLTVAPGGGGVSTIWSIRGGGILNGDATGACIQVQAAGTFTLTATVSRNGCSTTCEQTVVIDAPTSSIASTITSLCANDTTTLCGVVSPAAPNTNYAWTISGCGSILTSPTASCVKVKGCPGGGSFTAQFTATRGTCTTTNTKTITVAPPPPGPCAVCRAAYPDQTHLPMSKGTLDADSVVKTFDPKTGGLNSCIVGDTLLRVFYSSDRVMLLGYRQVQVKTSSGTTITNFPVPAIPTTPMCIREPNIGDTIRTGDLRYGDWYERPVFPALWITDITANAGSRAGDWRLGVIEAPPDSGVIPADKVCGLWKYAVRSYDKTLSAPRATTISDLPDAPKNFWNLGVGSDTPTQGFAAVPNKGYGAEAAWNLTRLGLLPGHTYRLFFSLYEGGENPHPNLGCTNLVIPPTSTTECLPAGVVAGDAEVARKPAGTSLDSPIGSVELLGLPHQFDLLQNQPNPFDRKTTISYAVPERSRVSIRVYTVTGQEVAVLVDGTFEAGRQAVSWSPVDRTGRPLQPGVYLYKLLAVSRSGAHQVTKKMVLLR